MHIHIATLILTARENYFTVEDFEVQLGQVNHIKSWKPSFGLYFFRLFSIYPL
jgi:hypothetical protein